MEREKGGIPGLGLLGSCSLPGGFSLLKQNIIKDRHAIFFFFFLERERENPDQVVMGQKPPLEPPGQCTWAESYLFPHTPPLRLHHLSGLGPGGLPWAAGAELRTVLSFHVAPSEGSFHVWELACMWQNRKVAVLCQAMKSCKLSRSVELIKTVIVFNILGRRKTMSWLIKTLFKVQRVLEEFFFLWLRRGSYCCL